MSRIVCRSVLFHKQFKKKKLKKTLRGEKTKRTKNHISICNLRFSTLFEFKSIETRSVGLRVGLFVTSATIYRR